MEVSNQTIELEAYRLIRQEARKLDENLDTTECQDLGNYVRGVVDLQTQMYTLSIKNGERYN